MSRFSISASLAIGMSLCATAAIAQNVCAGVGSGGQWIGGGADASDISTTDTHREQMALVLSGNKYISLFSLSETTDIRVEAAGRGNGDPAFEVLDTAGTVVASDDDSGGNGAARAEMTLDPGTYCVSLNSFDGAPMTAFVRVARTDQEALTMGIVETPDAPDESPIDCATATDLGILDGTLSGTGSAADTPLWRFTLAADAPITLSAQNDTADPTLTLMNSDSTLIAENDDFEGLSSRIDVTTPLAAGEYCIKIAALADPDLPIEVSIAVYDAQAALAALYAKGEAAPPIGGDYPISDLGALNTRLRQDIQASADVTWYSINIPDAGLLVVEAIGVGNGVDPWLILYDDLGRQIAQNDDHDGKLDSMAIARVLPGTFLLGIRSVNETPGFIRLLAARYVPAQ